MRRGADLLAVQPERAGDEQAISRVHAIAFGAGTGRSGNAEVRLVEQLRGSAAWVPELSLVARYEGEVIGHLLFSRAAIETTDGDIDVLALAPLAVLPGFEPAFAGTRLMRAGLREAHRLGFRGVVVLGHPKYYRRFGYVSAADRGIRYPAPVPHAAWMMIELVPGGLSGVTGVVRYPPAFSMVMAVRG